MPRRSSLKRAKGAVHSLSGQPSALEGCTDQRVNLLKVRQAVPSGDDEDADN
jgi:hypothetical protein